ncbi:hypothetical protein, partial [Methylobacterium hispanicum]|uniref:hypothetical protein n=1 Tax=Methylobacterium hispanicum TaxID=270350 RepID=UPI002F33FFBC
MRPALTAQATAAARAGGRIVGVGQRLWRRSAWVGLALYALALGGVLEFRFAYANPDATKRARLEHMVVLPPARDVG